MPIGDAGMDVSGWGRRVNVGLGRRGRRRMCTRHSIRRSSSSLLKAQDVTTVGLASQRETGEGESDGDARCERPNDAEDQFQTTRMVRRLQFQSVSTFVVEASFHLGVGDAVAVGLRDAGSDSDFDPEFTAG